MTMACSRCGEADMGKGICEKCCLECYEKHNFYNERLIEENQRLKAGIDEKLKNCQNCRYYDYENKNICFDCKHHNKWELRS